MKKTLLLFIAFTITFVIYAQNDENKGVFIDSRDNKQYTWVKIGEQIWMAENLAFFTSKGCWVYKKDTLNIQTDYYFYNWFVAKEVCPDGWHLPSKKEFETLISNYSNEDAQNVSKIFAVGGENGFCASIGFFRNLDGKISLRKEPIYWSSSLNPPNAIGMSINDYWGIYLDKYLNHHDGYSVRCIKD